MANGRDIPRTPDFTAFLANATGRGRVSVNSIARGKTAIVPESLRFEEEAQEQAQRPRSVVSDAGVFDSRRAGMLVNDRR